MRKRFLILFCFLFLFTTVCAVAENGKPSSAVPLEDGVYSASFTTDSSMFRVNETLDGRGTLTVSNGTMTIHVTLLSKKILNLYAGLAEDAQKEGAAVLQPKEDEVVYSDGLSEMVYGFDVPVPAIDEPFDLALVGTKGKWYDHKVTVSDPIPLELEQEGLVPDTFSFSGGTGRVVISCTALRIVDGQALAAITFSSPHYTYIKVDGQEYPCTHDENSSTAEIPVNLNASTEISAETTAMSTPHEIVYTIFVGYGETEDRIAGLSHLSDLNLEYAEGFTVHFYEGGYSLIDVKDNALYLMVPDGMPVPEGMNPEIIVLQQPLDHIYLAASAVMSFFDALDALNHIRLSATQEDAWYVENAAAAMARGDILFAGKYSEPDFELLLSEHCDLAIESMMITHSPKVKELIELLNIPVFVDRSSYEPHPLGRVEWIKLYGVLLGKQKLADEIFTRQAQSIKQIGTNANGPTVAYFSLRPDGTVTVRGARDYIARSIELAGGKYVFEMSEGQETNSSVNITMESFYQAAENADFIIYNSTIETPVESIEALLQMQPLFADFKAVKEGNVWCARRSLYQATDRIGIFIEDLRRMMEGKEADMVFLYKIPMTGSDGQK